MKICISAPEISGDLLAARLLPVLNKLHPNAEYVGLVGEKSSAQGVKPLWHTKNINVMGVVEVLKKLPRILRIRRSILRYCQQEQVDLFIGIDSPDFNFYVERKLKNKGVRTVHFVSPSIWAWRIERIHKIAQSTDIMLCLFPFEPELYHQVGMDAHFVGHPLTELAERSTYTQQNKIVLMPGSRVSEIKHILPTLVQTAINIHAIDSKYTFHIPLAHSGGEQFVQHWTEGTDISYSIGDAYEHIADADLVVVASGTAALEVALIGTPLVVVYRMNPWTYKMVRKKLTTEYISLPNILLNQQVVIELIQDNCNQATLVNAMFHTLQRAETQREKLAHIRSMLSCDFAQEVRKALS